MATAAPAPAPATFRAELVRVASSPLFQFLAATAVGAVILFARAPAAYVTPVLFAEDWPWTSMVKTRGFWDTALHARGDYHILGNVILIWLGLTLAEWFHGDVFLAPRCLAVVSYGFFAAAAALPLLLLRRQLPAVFRWAAWLLACLMPLGIHSQPPWSGVEILGRSVNVGFVFLFIAFVLLWHRNTTVRSFAAAVPVDLGLLACTTTNPVCIPMLAAAAWPPVRRWLVDRTPAGVVVRDGAFVSLCLLGIACVAVNGLPVARPPHVGTPSPPVSFAAAVEMGVARGLLYPAVWPVYRRLSTTATLAIAAGVVLAAWRWGQPRHRPVMLAGLATVGLVSAALVLQRGELAGFLGGYRTTFPDRYFVGQNLVALLLVVVLAADLAERLVGRPRLAWLPPAGLACLAVAAALHEPPWRIADSQFLLADDGAVEATAARAVRDGRFVDAAGTPRPDGGFVAIAVPRLSSWPLVLPRESVARALAVRRERRGAVAALEPAARF